MSLKPVEELLEGVSTEPTVAEQSLVVESILFEEGFNELCTVRFTARG